LFRLSGISLSRDEQAIYIADDQTVDGATKGTYNGVASTLVKNATASLKALDSPGKKVSTAKAASGPATQNKLNRRNSNET